MIGSFDRDAPIRIAHVAFPAYPAYWQMAKPSGIAGRQLLGVGHGSGPGPIGQRLDSMHAGR
jgi:hypothetical protein